MPRCQALKVLVGAGRKQHNNKSNYVIIPANTCTWQECCTSDCFRRLSDIQFNIQFTRSLVNSKVVIYNSTLHA